MSSPEKPQDPAKNSETSKDGAPAHNPNQGSLNLYPKQSAFFRVFALWYFAFLMTGWNMLGHTVLGFEQSWLHYCAAVGTALFWQFVLEIVDARANERPYRFAGSVGTFLNFLPPAIIAGSACGMILFPNKYCWPIMFASTLAIGSKVLLRAPMGNGVTQHAFNPSNLGIIVTLLVFPWVGIAPPYHFTNRIDIGDGFWNLLVPAGAMATGVFLHGIFTGRLPLILSWLGGFVLQALVRSTLAGVPLKVMLVPMTGASFVIFTLYMIPDPATTPIDTGAQIAFGLSIAAVYGLLFMLHMTYGWFLSLVIVAGLRYLALWARHLLIESP